MVGFLVWILLSGLILILWPSLAESRPAGPSSSLGGGLPLFFEPNRGQAPAGARFLARGPGYFLTLGGEGVELRGWDGPAGSLRMEWAGALPGPRPSGLGRLPGQRSYFRGKEPREWIPALPLYEKVRYAGIYPGTDLVFYGNPRQLEFDLILRPGADPDRIRLEFDRPFRLDGRGHLLFRMEAGAFRLRRPFAYQEEGGGRRRVRAEYVEVSARRVGLRLGPYDPDRSLTVDPILSYSGYLGGGLADSVSDVALDAEGNIYLTGSTRSPDFALTPAAPQRQLAGGQDVFVSKLNPSGDTLLFSTFLGGQGNDEGLTLAVDEAGNVHLAGSTDSVDFPLMGALQPEPGGGRDGFVLRLDPDGSLLGASTYLGGGRDDSLNRLAVSGGVIHVAGVTSSDDFPLAGPLQEVRGGGLDIVVAGLDASGSQLRYSSYLGGSLDEVLGDLVVDVEGFPHLVGSTRSGDFPTRSPWQDVIAGSTDAFVSKLESDGSDLIYSTYLGGRFSDGATAASLAPSGDLWLAGETSSADFPVASPLQPALAGATDLFVSRISAAGDSLSYSTFLGGPGLESPRGMAVDGEGQVHIVGASDSLDFPALGPLQVGGRGADAFLVKLSDSGSHLLSSTPLGGDGDEIATALALDPSGRAHLVGSADLPGLPAVQPLQPTFGGRGIYFSTNRALDWEGEALGLENPNVRSLAFDPVSPGIVYAGTPGGVFRSGDSGLTWEVLGLETEDIRLLAVAPQESLVLYAASSGSVFKSTDAGRSWEAANGNLPSGASFTALTPDPGQPGVIYLATDGRGIFKTTDGAGVWRAINNGLEGDAQRVFAVAVDPNDSSRVFIGTLGAVYFSEGAGSVWSRTSLSEVLVVSALLVDPVMGDTVYAAATSSFGNLVARTTDGGTNWRTGLPLAGPVTSLALDSRDRTVLYAGTAGVGVLKSTDAATSWEEVNSGLENPLINALALDPRDPSHLLLGVDSGSDGFLAVLDPRQVFYFPQVGEGTNTAIRLQTTLIFLNTGQESGVEVEFFDSAGEPLELTVDGLGRVARLEFTLGRGQARPIQVLGEDPLRTGYARVTTGDRVGGTAVFAQRDRATGRVDYEAGVPASRGQAGFSVFLDSLGVRDTGLALVQAAAPQLLPLSPAGVTATLFDKDANLIATRELELGENQHRAQFIREIFPEIADQVAEMQGVIELRSEHPLAALTLRQNDDPSRGFPDDVSILTSFPAFPRRGLRRETYFPQVADGIFGDSRFRTSLVFVNPDPLTATVRVAFVDPAGSPLDFALEELGTSSSFTVAVEPNQFRLLETTGQEMGRAGYARITASSPNLGGAAVFREEQVDSGVVYYEAGVPTASPLQGFSIFVDTLGVVDTGLALVNTATERGLVTLRLYDSDFNPVAEDTLELAPAQQVARFVWAFFPEIEATVREMQGVLTVESSVPLAAVTLRQNDDPVRSFPAEVPTLTAFPVIPGRAD